MPLKFPRDLDTSPKYGNQFAAFYVKDTEGTETSSEKFNVTTSVKNTRGEKIRGLSIAKGGSISLNNKKTIESIYLPIPTKISTNYGVTYTEFDVATEAIKIGVGVGSKLGGQISKGLNVGGGVGRAAAAVSSIFGGISSLSSEIGGAMNIAGKTVGLALNPHKELLFTGVNLRKFEFTWKLIARNEAESIDILNISNMFRKAMHPKLTFGSLLYKYPSEFDIEFWKSTDNSNFGEGTNDVEPNNFLTFVVPCVLESCTLSYSGGGEYVTFSKTGAPVELDLTLKFQETVVITKDLLQEVGE